MSPSRLLPSLLLTLLAPAAAAQQTRPADPDQGFGPDGRIPTPRLPEDLPNPDRWRYIPEGRLAPGSVFDRFLVSTFVSPILFREADVGVGGGFALTDVDFRNRRRREFANFVVTYTTEGQQTYRFAWRRWLHHRELPEGGVLLEERSYVGLNVGYSRTLTRRFFGIGPETKPSDETSYTDQLTSLGGKVQWSLPEPGGDWTLFLGLEGEHHNLSYGKVTGIPSMEDVHPGLYDAADDRLLPWLRARFELNTRDSASQPYHGTTLGLGVAAAPLQTEGRSGLTWILDATQVVPIPSPFHDNGSDDERNPPTDTLAFGAFLTQAEGDLPFYSLPSLGGGSTLRGYINDRWTDEAAWHASAEWRTWFIPRGFRLTRSIRIERIGAALFYDVGSVGPRVDAFDRAPVRDSYGAGLRIALERLAVFRIDLGFSDEDRNLTIAFGLPF